MSEKKIPLTDQDIENVLQMYNVETISYDDFPTYENLTHMFNENNSTFIVTPSVA